MSQKQAAPPGERQFIRRVLIVLGLTAFALLLWQLRSLLLMLFGAIVVASVFRALSDRIAKLTRIPEGVAVALSILIILGLVGAFAVMFGGQIGDQTRNLGDSLPAAWQSFQARIGEIGLGEQFRGLLEGATADGSWAGKIILAIGGGVADGLVVLFGGIFLAAQPQFYRAGAIKLVPSNKRGLVAEAMDDSERALRMWLKGQLIAMTIVGLLVGTGLWLLGVPSAFALGLLAGLLEFIPYAGPIMAAVPAILLALSLSPDLALWVAILYTVVQQFEGYLLQPLIQQYAVELPGVVLLFSLIGFGILFGPLGIILAAPLTVVTFVLVKRLYVVEALHTKTPIPGESRE